MIEKKTGNAVEAAKPAPVATTTQAVEQSNPLDNQTIDYPARYTRDEIEQGLKSKPSLQERLMPELAPLNAGSSGFRAALGDFFSRPAVKLTLDAAITAGGVAMFATGFQIAGPVIAVMGAVEFVATVVEQYREKAQA